MLMTNADEVKMLCKSTAEMDAVEDDVPGLAALLAL